MAKMVRHFDTEDPPGETCFEELYHYRLLPEDGFDARLVFNDDGTSGCYLTRSGNSFLIDEGNHSHATSPGEQKDMFTVLVGRHERSLVQNYKAEYRYLMAEIPGYFQRRG